MKLNIVLLVVLMLMTSVFGDGQVQVTKLSPEEVKKIQDNPQENQNKLSTYITQELKGDTAAAFELLPGSKIKDGKTLINPSGGELDIKTLSKDISTVKMLEKGGFSFSRKEKDNKEEVSLKGFKDVSMKDGKIISDGIVIQFEQGKGIFEKTKEGVNGFGKGKLFIDTREYAFDAEKGITFTMKEGHLQSVSLSATDKPAKLMLDKDTITVSRGTFTYFDKENDYNTVNANKIMKKGNQLLLSQKEDGALTVNDYAIDDGKIRINPLKLTSQRETMISYAYAGQAVTLPSTNDLAEYKSIADLFTDMGYGYSSANKDARKATYEKLFPDERYTGSYDQNIKFLTKLKQDGLAPAGKTTLIETQTGYNSGQEYVGGSPVVEKKPAITVESIPPEIATESLLPETMAVKKKIDGGVSSWIPYHGEGKPQGEVFKARTSFYFTCLEGDFGGYSSFEKCVITEGSGIKKVDDKLYVSYPAKEDGKWVVKNKLWSPDAARGFTKSGATPDIGTVAVPKSIYTQYKNHIAWLKTTDGRYIRVKLQDIGGAIKIRNDILDVDVWTGSGSSTQENVGGLGGNALYNKFDNLDYTTELIITEEIAS